MYVQGFIVPVPADKQDEYREVAEKFWPIARDNGAVEHVDMPDALYTTNICFGGPDLRTAYVTLSNSGRLVALDWPRPGLALNYSS